MALTMGQMVPHPSIQVHSLTLSQCPAVLCQQSPYALMALFPL